MNQKEHYIKEEKTDRISVAEAKYLCILILVCEKSKQSTESTCPSENQTLLQFEIREGRSANERPKHQQNLFLQKKKKRMEGKKMNSTSCL